MVLIYSSGPVLYLKRSSEEEYRSAGRSVRTLSPVIFSFSGMICLPCASNLRRSSSQSLAPIYFPRIVRHKGYILSRRFDYTLDGIDYFMCPLADWYLLCA